VAAVKGIKIGTAPQFLVLQLKRFSYDHTGRIKLNDKLLFGDTLDISPYMDCPQGQHTNYSLVSVLIHSGGAMGGHYYAFVFDVVQQKWFKFNDASVSEVDASQLEFMYGGTPTPPPGATRPAAKQQFSTNAYMLIYRRCGATPAPCPIPPYIADRIERENIDYQKKRELFIQKRDNLPLDVRFRDQHFVVHIDKHGSLHAATATAFNLAGLMGSQYTMDCVRLRKYNPKTGTMGRIFTEEAQTLEQLGFLKTSILRLEIRESEDPWPHDTGEFKLTIVTIDAEKKAFAKEVQVHVPSRDSTLEELQTLLKAQLNTPEGMELKLACVTPDGVVHVLTGPHKELQRDFNLQDGSTLHCEHCVDSSQPTVLESLFELLTHSIQLQFNLIGSQLCDQSLTMDERLPLATLKYEIGSRVQLAPSEFKLCKSLVGGEYKDDTKTLKELGLFDGQCLWISPGQPLRANQVKLSFVLFERTGDTRSMLPLGDALVAIDVPVEQLRVIASQYEAVSSLTTELGRLRLHLRKQNKLGPILFDGKGLQSCLSSTQWDAVTICVRVLDHVDVIQPTEINVEIQQWIASSQLRCQTSTEVILPCRSSFGSLRRIIAEVHLRIPLEHVAICRPLSYQLKNKDTMSALLNWDVDDGVTLEDGDLILFKDARDPEVLIDGMSVPKPKLAGPAARVVEEGLKIFTIFDAEGRQAFKDRGILTDEHAVHPHTIGDLNAPPQASDSLPDSQ